VIDVDALRDDAREVAAERLAKAHALLASVGSEERRAVEDVAYGVARGLAEALVAEAAESSFVDVALSACYPLHPSRPAGASREHQRSPRYEVT
jgi:hypothetical protein